MSLPNRMSRVKFPVIHNREKAKNIQTTEALANPKNFRLLFAGGPKGQTAQGGKQPRTVS